MNSLLVACCHPKGEANSYDGMFFRKNELASLAASLENKPLLYNHDRSMVLGKVVLAWVSAPSKRLQNEKRVFVLCQIDDNSVTGWLAKRGIEKRKLRDVSIGHTCIIDTSSRVDRVEHKAVTELSICREGAREKTHIHCISWIPTITKARHSFQRQRPTYIKATASKPLQRTPTKRQTSSQKMAQTSSSSSTETMNQTQPAQPMEGVSASTNSAAANSNVGSVEGRSEVEFSHTVLEQMKQMRDVNQQLSERLAAYEKEGRQMREGKMNGGVKDFILGLVKEYKQLESRKEEYDDMMGKLVESPTGSNVLDLLDCAASKCSQSIVETEKMYQERKKMQQENEALRKKVDLLSHDTFASSKERVHVGASAGLVSTSSRKSQNTGGKHDIFNEIGERLDNAHEHEIPSINLGNFKMQRYAAEIQDHRFY